MPSAVLSWAFFYSKDINAYKQHGGCSEWTTGWLLFQRNVYERERDKNSFGVLCFEKASPTPTNEKLPKLSGLNRYITESEELWSLSFSYIKNLEEEYLKIIHKNYNGDLRERYNCYGKSHTFIVYLHKLHESNSMNMTVSHHDFLKTTSLKNPNNYIVDIEKYNMKTLKV